MHGLPEESPTCAFVSKGAIPLAGFVYENMLVAAACLANCRSPRCVSALHFQVAMPQYFVDAWAVTNAAGRGSRRDCGAASTLQLVVLIWWCCDLAWD